MTEISLTFTEEHLNHITLTLRREGSMVTLVSEGDVDRTEVLYEGKDEMEAKRVYNDTVAALKERQVG